MPLSGSTTSLMTDYRRVEDSTRDSRVKEKMSTYSLRRASCWPSIVGFVRGKAMGGKDHLIQGEQ
ncbi:hypothetical protein ACO22_05674 [Paracoccidioides brasiliensis]|uniref:Uncharacterized protein n=1 Tax=Paracoccidioides brasiliensis TaxID=121759 RepID=A0A1D2J9U7_PARBR|nr:hypothetical protein ACO22_05674 [Paracoccidioides brasiliensis]ODH52196.1 hypothetical protein GX48_01753 [Paracoccidioides brasiliensis]